MFNKGVAGRALLTHSKLPANATSPIATVG